MSTTAVGILSSPLDRNIIFSGIIGRVAAKVGSKVASKGARKVANEAHHQNNNNNNNNRKHRRDIGGSDYEYQFEREFDDLDVRGFLDDLD